MDITPGLPETDNFQHWPPWRPLVVETARRILDYTGGTLVVPKTVLVEQYWREISSGLATYSIPVRHFVMHADQETLRRRINADTVLGPSPFRSQYLEAYAEAAATWLHNEAELIDTTHNTPAQVALQPVNGPPTGRTGLLVSLTVGPVPAQARFRCPGWSLTSAAVLPSGRDSHLACADSDTAGPERLKKGMRCRK